MSELQVIKESLENSVDFKSMVELAKNLVPKMISSTNAAMGAMEKITSIESEEDDKNVNNLLFRVKQTFDKVNLQRRQITDPYDEFRKTLMLIESEIDPKKGKENDYNRLKQLRESFAQAKLDKKRDEEDKLAKEKLSNTKLIEYSAAIKTKLSTGPMDKLMEADKTLTGWFNSITLENFDEKVKQINIKPKLKTELYDSWFIVNLDMSGVDQEKLEKAYDDAKKEFDYESVNKAYTIAAVKSLDEWKAKLPELKTRLENIQKADGEEKEKLESQLASKKKIEAEDAEKKLLDEKEAKEREIENEATDAKVEEEFREQGAKQNLDDTTSNSKYVARITDDNWLKPFATVMYNVAIHDDFKGLYKTDRSGKIKKDDKGRDVYIDPIDFFLKFYAAKCNAKIDGIKLFADAKVQTREAKK